MARACTSTLRLSDGGAPAETFDGSSPAPSASSGRREAGPAQEISVRRRSSSIRFVGSFGRAVSSANPQSLVSYGEIAPGLQQPGAILAVEQDGAPSARPRLVVTVEVTGGRDVSDGVELDVVRVEPTG
ncbi:hypothetical protein QR77_41615 [Streptomyces sp. 150FB]|nr:hypothetical protein QR77_41615 [Streptomyces sp. 150FB]